MISLSLYNGHNAAICIIKDGEIILNWELERFSRIKHDYGFNKKFFKQSLKQCKLSFDDLDYIITNNQNYKRKPPWKVPSTSDEYCIEFNIKNKKAYALNHHLCHVSSSYYSSSDY